jgi:hypothetical protein
MMVFDILLAMTSPTRSLRLVLSTAVPTGRVELGVESDIQTGLGRFFAQSGYAGFDAGNIAAQRAQASRFFELGAGLLQAQVKDFLAQVASVRSQLFQRFFLNLFALSLLHKQRARISQCDGEK